MLATGCGSDNPATPTKEEEEPNPIETIASIAVSAEQSRVIGVDVILQLTAVAKNAQGTVLSDIDFTWSSADTAIATVNNLGQVTTTGLGSVRIADQNGIGVYGAGWVIDGANYNHSGALEGSNSILSILEDGRVVALLFNGNINISFASFHQPNTRSE